MQRPVLWAFEFLFGCHHRHMSRVFTIKARSYRVCLDCARQFDYSWESICRTRSGVETAFAAGEDVRRAEVLVN